MEIISSPSIENTKKSKEKIFPHQESSEKNSDPDKVIKEQEAPEQQQEPDVYEQARMQITTLCEEHEDPKEILKVIMKKVDPFFQHIDKKILPEEKIEEIKENLEACALVQNKDEFIRLTTEALKPMLDIREEYTPGFEDAQAKAMNETGGFIEINRLLSYGQHGAIVHIHAPAGKTVENKIGLYRNGMTKLAEIVNNDPEIKEIIATSYIVDQHPGLFTRFGFKIEDVTEEFKRKYFAGEKRKIKKASINREDFLEKFLKT